MGLFDTIVMDVVCPYCGLVSHDVQTKDLVCFQEVFRVGDNVGEFVDGPEFGLPAHTLCKCGAWLELRVSVVNGLITGKYDIDLVKSGFRY